jgi:seryl-tRNA synthetase
MYYTELDGAEPTVSIQVSGTKYTLTTESLTKLIEAKESLKTELTQVERKFKSAQFDVREFFQARYETDSDEIVANLDDINNLLTSIGSEELTKSWSSTITITATITGIEAANKEAVEDIIQDSVEVNFNSDGDIWVDDISVDSVYPEA